MPRNVFWMQQLLILLINQQLLSHGSWATRTPSAGPSMSPTPAPPSAATPLVFSSEATLLTTHRRFPSVAELSASPAPATDASDASSSTEAAIGRYKIIAVHANCTRDLFEMHIELNRGFRGLLYAKDFPLECRARGTARSNITLRLPTSGCGVRADPRDDGIMELSVRVMLQMEQKLRQSSDILRTVRCKLPMNAMGMAVTVPSSTNAPISREGKARQGHRNGRMRKFKAGVHSSAAGGVEKATTLQSDEPFPAPSQTVSQHMTTTTTTSSSSTPRVRIWLELEGPDGSGAVEVGQPTTLTVRAIVPGKMGVRVVDCAALDGLGESTQQLLDSIGCPIDEQVMPALHTHFKPAEEGWSKQLDDDLIEKMFTATFPAFKFPDRERLHVSCGVQLCKEACPNVNCRSPEKFDLNTDKQLARIEVFNSLAVTAPQIEVDRLRYDRRFNMSAEELPPNVRPLQTEGTLCLSVSKLAISFCVLGFIFLIAIIVAICSLIRSRRRSPAQSACTHLTPAGNRMHRAEVCTSMFSSSSESAQSARFGSKLFMPYYPNTLPYGRVY